jgi:hypothetical protein
MADFVTDGKIGIDLTAVYASTSAGSVSLMPATPGQRVHTNNNGTYIFARCQSDCSQYDAVIFSTFGDSASLTPTTAFVPITTTNAAALGYNMVGFVQNSVASSYYTWVLLNGYPRVNLLIAAQPKVPLYTTATAGKLDDTTVSAGYIVGLVANTSATSASAPYCVAQWPHLITSNPV